MPRGGLDYGMLLHEFRTHTTEWVAGERAAAVRAQREWRMRELAATAVLDERGRIDDAVAAADGVSVRSVRERMGMVQSPEQPGLCRWLAAGLHAEPIA